MSAWSFSHENSFRAARDRARPAQGAKWQRSTRILLCFASGAFTWAVIIRLAGLMLGA